MTQTHGIMLVLPLAVGLAAIIATILIQGMASFAKRRDSATREQTGGRMFGSLL
jgi:hypothetical protein